MGNLLSHNDLSLVPSVKLIYRAGRQSAQVHHFVNPCRVPRSQGPDARIPDGLYLDRQSIIAEAEAFKWRHNTKGGCRTVPRVLVILGSPLVGSRLPSTVRIERSNPQDVRGCAIFIAALPRWWYSSLGVEMPLERGGSTWFGVPCERLLIS